MTKHLGECGTCLDSNSFTTTERDCRKVFCLRYQSTRDPSDVCSRYRAKELLSSRLPQEKEN